MALILAIEPEREQAALLTSLIRGRLGAELVLADTTEQALVAIGDRVPDLVLIPALLSAREDAALAGALRMIAAAAQVQMLTIPFLAAPVPVPERRGVLAKWRRGRNASPSLSGCDPAVFADQIAAYLAGTDDEQAVNTVVEDIVETHAVTIDAAQRASSDVPLVLRDALFAAVEAPVPSDAFATGVEEISLSGASVIGVKGLSLRGASVIEGPARSDALSDGVAGIAGVGESAERSPAPVTSVTADKPRDSDTYVPRSFALIDWQHAAGEMSVASEPQPIAVEAPAPSDTIIYEVEAPALGDALIARVEGPVLSDAPAAGAEGPGLPDSIDELIARAIEQFAAAPSAADAAKVDDPVVPPIDEMAAAPSPTDVVLTEAEGPALSHAPFIEVEAPVPSDALFIEVEAPVLSAAPFTEAQASIPSAAPLVEVEAPVLSDAPFIEVEPPIAAIAAAEAAALTQSIVDEPVARGEEAPVAATAEDVGDEEASDNLWISEPAPESLPIAAVAAVARNNGWPVPAMTTVVTSPIGDDDVVVDFDETPVYELSLDELASDAALMASIDAMMAPRGAPQAPVVGDRASDATEQVSNHASSSKEEAAAQPAVEMPAPETFVPAEWIPEVQTEPDPLFFCDAEPAPSPIESGVPRAFAAPVVTAAAAKPERPEWVELIESLRKDIERLKAERAEPAAGAASRAETPVATPSSRTSAASAVRKAKRPKPAAPKTPRPAQDEWGLFDPEQCGFASLLAKLSEITDVNDSGSSSRSLDH